MNTTARFRLLAQFELNEVLRSRWIALLSLLYLVLAAVFVLAALRESAILGFTGMGRVLLSMCHALVLLLPLLALTACSQVVNRARVDGTLEFVFGQPVNRGDYFAAASLVRYGMLVLPLVVLMPGLALFAWVAFGQGIPWSFLGRALAVSASLSWAFVGLGMVVSVLMSDQAKAMIFALLIWAVGVALLDFALVGLMLEWQLNPQSVFALGALNPVEAARTALLSAADPSLRGLGPVGFYLANRLGSGALLLIGTIWPSALGTVAWIGARHAFKTGDLV